GGGRTLRRGALASGARHEDAAPSELLSGAGVEALAEADPASGEADASAAPPEDPGSPQPVPAAGAAAGGGRAGPAVGGSVGAAGGCGVEVGDIGVGAESEAVESVVLEALEESVEPDALASVVSDELASVETELVVGAVSDTLTEPDGCVDDVLPALD